MFALRLALVGLCAAATTVHAQDFTGTYTVQDQAGGTVTFVLSQDAQGQITGSLSGGGRQLHGAGTPRGGYRDRYPVLRCWGCLFHGRTAGPPAHGHAFRT